MVSVALLSGVMSFNLVLPMEIVNSIHCSSHPALLECRMDPSAEQLLGIFCARQVAARAHTGSKLCSLPSWTFLSQKSVVTVCYFQNQMLFSCFSLFSPLQIC
jgi:hypothetical protein